MKIAVQYLNDSSGKTKAVQVPLGEWKKLMNKLRKYEQALQLKSDIKEALAQVAILKRNKGNKSTLKDFLNEL